MRTDADPRSTPDHGDEPPQKPPSEPVGGSGHRGAIARKTARGGIILAARSAVTQVAQVASTLAIAHFLLPEAYGTVAVALTALGFARYVGDLGLTLSLIAAPRVDENTVRASAGLAVICAVGETLVIFAVASPLAALLHGPGYSAEVIRLFGLCLLGEAFRFGPVVRINRDLAFAELGLLQLSDSAILYGAQIGLLLAGGGVWSLVLSQLARSFLGTAVYVLRAGEAGTPGFRLGNFSLIRRGLPYQGTSILAGLGGFLTPIVLATVMSVRDVGFWAWATVLVTPLSALTSIMSAITLPSLARLRRTDPAAVDRAAAIMLRAALLLPAAGAGVLLGFSRPIVNLVFGPRWEPALLAVEINLVGIIPSTLSFFLAAILESAQRARERFVASLAAQAIGLPLVFALASVAGVAGASGVTGVAVPLIDIVVLARLARMSIGGATARAALALAIAAGVGWSLARVVTSVAELIVAGAATVPVVLVLVWCIDREAMSTLIRWGVPLPAWLNRVLRIHAHNAG